MGCDKKDSMHSEEKEILKKVDLELSAFCNSDVCKLEVDSVAVNCQAV